MLDPHRLKTFLAVAAGLSFREAAQTLNLSPSTVSGHIRELEEELGVALFDRTSRRVLLTEEGLGLAPRARRLLDLEADTRRLFAGHDAPPLELAVRLSESLGIYRLQGLLRAFRAEHPRVRLVLAVRSRHGLARDLRHGVTDLALILGQPLASGGLEQEVLGHEPLAVIAAPDSPLAGLDSAGANDLAGHPLVVTRHLWSARPLLERALARDGVYPGPVVECDSVEIVKRCVMAGMGVSLAPVCTVEREAEQGLLAAPAWRDEPLSAPVLLVRDPGRRPSPSARDFARLARQAFAGRSEKARPGSGPPDLG